MKRRTEERASISSLEDVGEEVREEASVEGSQVCTLVVHPPVDVPDSKGVLDEGGRGAWEEISLNTSLEVFTSK